MISLDAGGFLFQQNAFYMKMFITEWNLGITNYFVSTPEIVKFMAV